MTGAPAWRPRSLRRQAGARTTYPDIGTSRESRVDDYDAIGEVSQLCLDGEAKPATEAPADTGSYRSRILSVTQLGGVAT